MVFQKKKYKNIINGFKIYDIILQFFLARTSKIKLVKWDNELKTVEHMEFFWRAKDILNITYIGDTHNFKIKNTNNYSNTKYKKLGFSKKFIHLSRQKMGILNVKIVN